MQSGKIEPKTTDGPDSMRWPTLRHKLTPVHAFRWPAYAGFGLWFRDWYHGPWIMASMGWWCVQIGSGTYD